METTIINEIEYIASEILFDKAPVFCKSRNARDLLKKKNIAETNYVFAKLNKENIWMISDGNSRKFDKVFFTKTFVETIPEINQEKIIVDDNNVELAPKIIHLKEHEKFKDDNGNIIEIETRGERKNDKIYFKLNDVSAGFDMGKLQDTLINSISNYKEIIDYKYFICIKTDTIVKKTFKKIYLTYSGLLKVLFVSRSGSANNFVKWATETLFTAQMGTTEQKRELASSILGTDAKTVKEVFSKDRNTLPCIYLFALNTVAELRTSMNIDAKFTDDSIVAKYGYTKDLARRTGEHINKYNKIGGVDLKLKHYCYIDPQFCSTAEANIRTLMTSYNIQLEYEDEDELVVIPKELMKIIEDYYGFVAKKYAGHISEFITQIKDFEYEKRELEQKHKFLEQTYVFKLAEAKHENEMLKKDNQILQLQLQLHQQK